MRARRLVHGTDLSFAPAAITESRDERVNRSRMRKMHMSNMPDDDDDFGGGSGGRRSSRRERDRDRERPRHRRGVSMSDKALDCLSTEVCHRMLHKSLVRARVQRSGVLQGTQPLCRPLSSPWPRSEIWCPAPASARQAIRRSSVAHECLRVCVPVRRQGLKGAILKPCPALGPEPAATPGQPSIYLVS